MDKISKFFYVRNLTEKLRSIQSGESIILEMKNGVSFNTAMRIVASTTHRIGIPITQTAMKGVDCSSDCNIAINLIRVTHKIE